MSAERNDSKPLSKNTVLTRLNDIVDFGPDTANIVGGTNDRIQQLVKKVQEITQRIDRLNKNL